MTDKMVDVYRVEHYTSGDGPYGVYSSWEDSWHCADNGHPVPRLDGLESFPPSYSFGFESHEQLREWFSLSERARLARLGYVISVYSVSSRMIRKGGKQIVFNKKRAKLIKFINEMDL